MGRRVQFVGYEEMVDEFGCDAVHLPDNVSIVGWSAPRRSYLVHHARTNDNHSRLAGLLRFWHRYVRPLLPDRSFWLTCCLWDGWRERTGFAPNYRWVEAGPQAEGSHEWRGGPGEIPLLSRTQPVVGCFARQVGDPSALLLPEAYYLERQYYRPLALQVTTARRPWGRKRDSAVYCGKDWGESLNMTRTPMDVHARRLLQQVVEAQRLAVRVHLGSDVGRRAQMAHKYILDVDGYVRTFDAWAWKLISGSVVLSQDSIWETFFTRQFEPWRHFVPVANDFSDLGEKLDWCRAHDEECQAITRRARARAIEVYAPRAVAPIVAADARRCVVGLR